jgi:hypothetical protein
MSHRASSASLFAVDPAVATLGPVFEILSPRSWVFRLPHELRSPNATIWRPWTGLAADRAKWERLLRGELREWQAMRNLIGFTQDEARAGPHVTEHSELRALTVTRYVPSRAHFMRDERNLQFSIKGLEDALVRVGLLVDDRREWLRCAPVTQHLCPTGAFVTVVLLQRPDLSGAEVSRA